jgi:drug/metabolite transporter (DMT)-like permease
MWLIYAIITTLFWGVWGALIEITQRAGFPDTLGYVVWSLTLIPCSIIALKHSGWKLDHDPRSIFLGCAVGFLGAGGQMILFKALTMGPAYLVFPIVSVYPVLTILLSVSILKERAALKSWAGIVLALIAVGLLSYQPPSSVSVATNSMWLVLAMGVFVAWGVQAYVMKFSNNTMTAESIFFYMMITGVALAPVAVMLTDFSKPINWGFTGPYLAALIQVLNSIGALCLVYALRYGKAIIVTPMTALAPVLTIILSLAIYQRIPETPNVVGIVFASIAIYLMAE